MKAAKDSAGTGSARFSDLLSGAILATRSDAIVATDHDGIIRFWNPGSERIFGHSRDQAIGCTLDLIIPERLRARHWEGFANVVRTGQSRYGEGDLLSVPAIRRDGATISVQFTITLLRDSGQLVGMAAIIRDVTRQFRETRELKLKLSKLFAAPASDS